MKRRIQIKNDLLSRYHSGDFKYTKEEYKVVIQAFYDLMVELNTNTSWYDDSTYREDIINSIVGLLDMKYPKNNNYEN